MKRFFAGLFMAIAIGASFLIAPKFMCAGVEPPSPMLGKVAPDFSIDLLDGGKLNLAEHKGKHIVILDFWTTWCPPCRASLPRIAEIAEKYKDKGVVFYAINLREEPAIIKEFLSQDNLKIAVGLDKDDVANTAYNVQIIPMSFIIDKNGVIQAVHAGALNLFPKIEDELKSIIEGKSLAPKADDPAGPKNGKPVEPAKK